MRTENDEIRDNLKYLTLLSRDYPSQAAAASEIISTQALLKLPKGTEHFMSDLHGENEAFVHILNSASGVIREKVDLVLGEAIPEQTRAELATLIYYPNEKLPQLKNRCTSEEALDQWYTDTLLRLIDICRLVSSKHTRDHVRQCLPASCGYILDELLHAHFEDHDKDLYYGQIVGSIIENGRADRFIVRLCELIKHLAVDKLHIVGDLFDRGPRPDIILDLLMRHHNVDIQWGNHDVVWMGAAAGSPICICTVLKTTLAYHNHSIEFERFNGRTMLEILYAEAPEIDAELDTYWVQKGGADPVRWIETLAGRQQVLHLKDYGMKPFCECGDSVMMPVGEGNLDWKRILDAAGRAGVTCWVVEHDGDTSDPVGSFASSIRFLKENFSR